MARMPIADCEGPFVAADAVDIISDAVDVISDAVDRVSDATSTSEAFMAFILPDGDPAEWRELGGRLDAALGEIDDPCSPADFCTSVLAGVEPVCGRVLLLLRHLTALSRSLGRPQGTAALAEVLRVAWPGRTGSAQAAIRTKVKAGITHARELPQPPPPPPHVAAAPPAAPPPTRTIGEQVMEWFNAQHPTRATVRGDGVTVYAILSNVPPGDRTFLLDSTFQRFFEFLHGCAAVAGFNDADFWPHPGSDVNGRTLNRGRLELMWFFAQLDVMTQGALLASKQFGTMPPPPGEVFLRLHEIVNDAMRLHRLREIWSGITSRREVVGELMVGVGATGKPAFVEGNLVFVDAATCVEQLSVAFAAMLRPSLRLLWNDEAAALRGRLRIAGALPWCPQVNVYDLACEFLFREFVGAGLVQKATIDAVRCVDTLHVPSVLDSCRRRSCGSTLPSTVSLSATIASTGSATPCSVPPVKGPLPALF